MFISVRPQLSFNGNFVRSASSLTIPAILDRARAREGIFSKRSGQSLLAADFLATNKAIHSDSNGTVNVAIFAVL